MTKKHPFLRVFFCSYSVDIIGVTNPNIPLDCVSKDLPNQSNQITNHFQIVCEIFLYIKFALSKVS